MEEIYNGMILFSVSKIVQVEKSLYGNLSTAILKVFDLRAADEFFASFY